MNKEELRNKIKELYFQLEASIEIYYDDNKLDLRSNGKSTRLVDTYVQELLLLGKVDVKDDSINTQQESRILARKILSRINKEHGHRKYNIKGIDKSYYVILEIKDNGDSKEQV